MGYIVFEREGKRTKRFKASAWFYEAGEGRRRDMWLVSVTDDQHSTLKSLNRLPASRWKRAGRSPQSLSRWGANPGTACAAPVGAPHYVIVVAVASSRRLGGPRGLPTLGGRMEAKHPAHLPTEQLLPFRTTPTQDPLSRARGLAPTSVIPIPKLFLEFPSPGPGGEARK